jgi:hypothetical protein
MDAREARTEIYNTFLSGWNDAGLPVVNTGPNKNLFWQDVKGEMPKNPDFPFARAFIQHVETEQVTLQSEPGERVYARYGLATFMLHAPTGSGYTTAYEIAERVIRRFQAADGCIWFKNVRLEEMGGYGNYVRIDVLVEFRYEYRI